MRRLVALAIAAALIVSCSSDDTTTTNGTTNGTTNDTTIDTTSETAGGTTQPPITSVEESVAPTTDGVSTSAPVNADPLADRPFDVFVPTTYDAQTAMPLVVLLHGFGASGIIQNLYFGLQPLAESRGFLYVYPDGTILEPVGRQFWNATDACCGFGSTVDDVAYLGALVDDVQSNYNVDPKRIFFVGHSNGGFMSYRMACDRADMVAAVASLAGATWMDNSKCNPSEPVSVLQIHGTDDETIAFDGAVLRGNEHPGAQQTVATWAGNNGCTGALTDLPTPLDLEAELPGAESAAAQFAGCPVNGAAELWTIPDGAHVPPLSPTFGAQIIDFLFAHPKA